MAIRRAMPRCAERLRTTRAASQRCLRPRTDRRHAGGTCRLHDRALLLTDPGDPLLFEDPGPLIAPNLFESLGRKLVQSRWMARAWPSRTWWRAADLRHALAPASAWPHDVAGAAVAAAGSGERQRRLDRRGRLRRRVPPYRAALALDPQHRTLGPDDPCRHVFEGAVSGLCAGRILRTILPTPRPALGLYRPGPPISLHRGWRLWRSCWRVRAETRARAS